MVQRQGTVPAIARPASFVLDRFGTRGAGSGRISPDGWAILAIAGAVVVAHALYLLGFFDAHLLGPRSGLVSALTPGGLGGQTSVDPSDGLVGQALGHRAALDLLHLHLPWWNPYEGTGAPLFADMQSAALFPFTLLTAFANGPMYEYMLLEFVAGVSTYLLLRRIGINPWASGAAAVAFALNGTFAWLAQAPANPVAFLPLLLLGIELAYSATVAASRGGWWVMALAGALSVYAGFPEVAYIDALMAGCWFAWRSSCLGRERLKAFVGKAAAATAVGTLLAAPLLIASIGYIAHGDLGFNSTGVLGSAHLVPQASSQLLLPYAYGPIFAFTDYRLILYVVWVRTGGYLAASLLLFGLLGMFSKGRRGLRVALVLWLVLALARMYGKPPLIWKVLGVLPGMSHVNFARYAFASVELTVIILAALGLDSIAVMRPPRRRLICGALASLVLLAIAAIGARSLVDQLGTSFSHHFYYQGSIIWGAVVVVSAAAAGLIRNSRLRIRLIAVIVACDALVMFAIPQASAPRSARTDLAPVAFLQRHLGTARFFTLGALAPNYGSYFGLASLDINDVPVPSAFSSYVHLRLDRDAGGTVFGCCDNVQKWPLFGPPPPQPLIRNLGGYREAGVAYVLTPAGQELPQSPSTFRLVFRSPSTWIYHLAGAASYFTTSDPRCSVEAMSRESARVTCPQTTTLIRRETDLPGWSAQVDGRQVSVRTADGLFQSIRVPAGKHRIAFSYLPPYIGWGLLALAAGCVWLLACAVAERRDRRRFARSAIIS